jgi:hypothetical protein
MNGDSVYQLPPMQLTNSAADPDHIDIQNLQQLDVWSRHLGVGTDVLREAIKTFGNSTQFLRGMRRDSLCAVPSRFSQQTVYENAIHP